MKEFLKKTIVVMTVMTTILALSLNSGITQSRQVLLDEANKLIFDRLTTLREEMLIDAPKIYRGATALADEAHIAGLLRSLLFEVAVGRELRVSLETVHDLARETIRRLDNVEIEGLQMLDELRRVGLDDVLSDPTVTGPYGEFFRTGSGIELIPPKDFEVLRVLFLEDVAIQLLSQPIDGFVLEVIGEGRDIETLIKIFPLVIKSLRQSLITLLEVQDPDELRELISLGIGPQSGTTSPTELLNSHPGWWANFAKWTAVVGGVLIVAGDVTLAIIPATAVAAAPIAPASIKAGTAIAVAGAAALMR